MNFHKYRAKKIKHDGYSFASKLEAAVYDLLMLRMYAKEIKQIQPQAHVYLTRARVLLIPDFKVTLANDEILFIESKGFETSDWRIKKRLWKYYGPNALEIGKGPYKKPYLDETIIPKKDFTEDEYF